MVFVGCIFKYLSGKNINIVFTNRSNQKKLNGILFFKYLIFTLLQSKKETGFTVQGRKIMQKSLFFGFPGFQTKKYL